jgi:hypothetical protein
MSPSEVVNDYGISRYGVQPLSLDLLLVTILGITERERRTACTQLDQQGKAWTTNTQQDWPINMTINRRLLDMKGNKGLMS